MLSKIIFFLPLLLCSCAVSVSPLNSPPQSKGLQHSVPETTEVDAIREFVQDRWCPSDVGTVRVVNPKPVAAKDAKAKALRRLTDKTQTFAYGDSCLSEADGWWHALGVDGEAGNVRVLVQYWGPVQRETYSSCPSGALFFLDFATFQQRCETAKPEPDPKEVISEQQKQEKETVQRLIKEHQLK